MGETGRGLPDVALMLPLCEALGVTVNDLLAGQLVEPANYQQKAEENMMDLMRENQENKKRFILAAACTGVTVVAVCALVTIASVVELPAAARVAVLALAVATGAAGIGTAAALDAQAGCYECPSCGQLFVPVLGEYVKGYHTLARRRLTCPHCGKTGMCRRKLTR